MTHNYSGSTCSTFLAPCQPSVACGKCQRLHLNGEDKKDGTALMDLPFNNINCGFKHECDLLWTLRQGSEVENGKPNSSPSINQYTPPSPEWTGTAMLSWNDSPLTHWDNVQRNHVQGIRRIPDKWERRIQMCIANDENWLHISSNCCWFNVG